MNIRTLDLALEAELSYGLYYGIHLRLVTDCAWALSRIRAKRTSIASSPLREVGPAFSFFKMPAVYASTDQQVRLRHTPFSV